MLKYACVHNMFGVTSQPRRLKTAVAAALGARDDHDPRDVGAEHLALRYAALIDEAGPAAKYRKHLDVLSRVVLLSDDPNDADDAREALNKVRDALAHQAVVSDLGPKLLAALAALGLTTAARQAVKGGTGGTGQHQSPLDELRARRAARQHNAKTVDASSS